MHSSPFTLRNVLILQPQKIRMKIPLLNRYVTTFLISIPSFLFHDHDRLPEITSNHFFSEFFSPVRE